MVRIYLPKTQFLAGCATAILAVASLGPASAAEVAGPRVLAQAAGVAASDDRQILLQRLQQFEQRLNQLEGRQLEGRGGAAAPTPAMPGTLDTQAILERLNALDQRLMGLETNAVLSEPKTIVRQKEVYVDDNGIESDEPGPGRREVTTYERERVFRRQSIGEEIGEALAAQEESGISVGVSSVTTIQGAVQGNGAKLDADGHVFGVTQADVTFSAQSAALNTSFFADVVAIGGPGPDGEIPSLSLLNSQGARLSNNRLQTR